MITFYAFGRVHRAVIGETRDLRVQWALEELELPYRVHGIDHDAGENLSPVFSAISPFNQIPVIEDDGFVVAETAAILLYLAEKAGRLPADVRGRTRVTQWCVAALATVETPLAEILNIDKFGKGQADPRRPKLVKWAQRVLDGLERRLDGRPWIAGDEFTVADILTVCVLREVRTTDLLAPYPRLTDYYARAQARPAYKRAMALYAERLGVTVDEIA